MSELSDFDVFSSSPIQRVRNTGYFKQKNGWEWESKCDYSCFYCVEKGIITVILNGRTRKAHSGDVIFIKSGDEGAKLSACEGDAAYYFLSFYCEDGVELGIDTLSKGADAVDAFKEFRRAYYSEAPLYRIKVAELFLRILHRLASLNVTLNESGTDVKVRAAIEYINMNYYKRITVDELCGMTNYSKAHLRRLFIKHLGVPPSEYIIEKKISIARDMLIDSPEKTVDEIADSLSFCSASYLCKLFKKHYGMPILQYKKQIKGK